MMSKIIYRVRRLRVYAALESAYLPVIQARKTKFPSPRELILLRNNEPSLCVFHVLIGHFGLEVVSR